MRTPFILVLVVFALLHFGVEEVSAKVKFGLHFDQDGKLIMPDQEFLARGFNDDEKGFRKSAIKNFKRSASYGNHYAMSIIGLYHLQDEAYIKSLAWFKMVDLSALENRKRVEDVIYKLENYLTKDDLKEVEELKERLTEIYSNHQTRSNREEWLKNLKVTGTRIKGHIPGFLTFNIMRPGQPMDFYSTAGVTGYQVRNQIEEFVYEYDFNFSEGDVKLNDVELIDDDAFETKK